MMNDRYQKNEHFMINTIHDKPFMRTRLCDNRVTTYILILVHSSVKWCVIFVHCIARCRPNSTLSRNGLIFQQSNLAVFREAV